jgi:hypothetical protein
VSLKSALFEMKEGFINLRPELSEEHFIHDLENKNELRDGSLIWYYNQLMMMRMHGRDPKNEKQDDSKKVNRKWSKHEINFMLRYINERQEEWGVNITEILDEVANLLNRGYQSVNYKYYSLIKLDQDMKKDNQNQNQYHITTINQENVPVIFTEVVNDTSHRPEFDNSNFSLENDDLLDVLSGLLTNVQRLPGINLNELFRSLYQLTNLALQNQNENQKIEMVKSKVNLEKENLQEKLAKKEQRLLVEKKRNDELQSEVFKLEKEIRAFNQLGDTAKIQNLKSYNQKLSFIIDRVGLKYKVGS